ncbi:preprotein translocase subunit SecE [Alicyclobacillus sp. SO9]|uniref:preprotein translocase subunit SecE n=1 Tax=Alicyclobacillus sp. SO9 TaxID=2665646 RepID=UPI0018E7D8D5|nr:preprotein translocase subunit SecE [Alicyclobacillus sp. SO9]QQE78544.1 preprotein translocase subunit SecE [Alicyclobacillus sp. SO9]
MAKGNTDSTQGTQPERRRTRTGVVTFTRETVQELKRVRWPKRNEVVSYTAAVLIVCFVMGLLVWLFDIGVARLMALIGLV